MQQGTFTDEHQRTLGADDLAGLLYAMAGIDEISGTADDYTLILTYAGLTNNADIVIDFDNAETGFAVSQSGGAFIASDHIAIVNNNIYFSCSLKKIDDHNSLHKRTKASDVVIGFAVVIDIDIQEDVIKAISKIENNEIPKPSIFLLTSKKPALRAQLIWRIKPTTDLKKFKLFKLFSDLLYKISLYGSPSSISN